MLPIFQPLVRSDDLEVGRSGAVGFRRIIQKPQPIIKCPLAGGLVRLSSLGLAYARLILRIYAGWENGMPSGGGEGEDGG